MTNCICVVQEVPVRPDCTNEAATLTMQPVRDAPAGDVRTAPQTPFRQQLLFSSLPRQLCFADRLPLHKKERGAASVSTRPARHLPAFPLLIARFPSSPPS